MLYSKINFLLMLLSIVLIIAGFALMWGGGSDDPEVFNPEIFSARRTVAAPLVCLSGFVLMGVSLLVRFGAIEPKEGEEA